MTDDYLTPEEIGARVRELREARDMAQKDLASATGMDAAALSRVETGQRGLAIAELVSVAQALEIDPDEILLREAEPTPLFRNEGGEQAAAEAVGRMQSIMDDFLSFKAVVGG